MGIIVAKHVTIQDTGSSDAAYLVLSHSSALRNDRLMEAGYGITLTDGGAKGSATIAVDTEILNEQTITGSVPLRNETPSGNVDGLNTIYTTIQVPSDIDLVRVFVNGIRQKSGSGADYVVSAPQTIQLQYTASSGDQLLVDYFTTGSVIIAGWSRALQIVKNETPNGSIDGSNQTFTLQADPFTGACIEVFNNGVRQQSGSSADYVFVPPKSIQMQYAPATGDQLIVDYCRSGSNSSNSMSVAYRPIINDAPSGSVDGANTIFTLSYEPAAEKYVEIFNNGVRQQSGSSADYIVTNKRTVQFQYAPTAGDQLTADYLINISGTFAPIEPSYLVVSTSLGLPNERLLTAGHGIELVDNGSNSTLIVATTQYAAFPPVVQLSSDQTLTTGSIVLADAISGSITLTLPSATSSLQFVVKKIDSSSNTVTVQGSLGQTIDGASNYQTNVQWTSRRFVASSVGWFII